MCPTQTRLSPGQNRFWVCNRRPEVRPATIGIVVNPASGKDVRRLVARASIFDNREKGAIISRAIVGATSAGASTFVYLDDAHHIARTALAELPASCNVTMIPGPKSGSALDTIRGAEELRRHAPVVTLILGGDGTNRAFVKGWRESILLPLSTGTNNVFPSFAEATIAGAALGLVASGRVTVAEVSGTAKIIDVDIEGEAPDLALIDAAVTSDRFIASRALLNLDKVRQVILTRAEAGSVGMTSLGGLLRPVSAADEFGLHLVMGAGSRVHAPVAPGMFAEVPIKKVTKLAFGTAVALQGPCTLAFDGERERTIQPGQRVSLRISRTGPRVLDIDKTMCLAAKRQLFTRQ